MEFVAEGIAVFRGYFVQTEEVIAEAEAGNWRSGTAGGQVNPEVRITDIHDLDQTTELHNEMLQTFVSAMNEYGEGFPQLQIKGGESLRVARYQEGGHYKPHIDAGANNRVLSALLYLNDEFTGGELDFPLQGIKIKPEAGMIVLFPSNFMFPHASLPITKGVKYCTVAWFS